MYMGPLGEERINGGHAMAPRLDYRAASPKAVATMVGLETYVHSSGLEEPLLQLIKTRASQINGCAYCIDRLAIPFQTVPGTYQPSRK
jgi:alkylhydroperoxidase family enzyme